MVSSQPSFVAGSADFITFRLRHATGQRDFVTAAGFRDGNIGSIELPSDFHHRLGPDEVVKVYSGDGLRVLFVGEHAGNHVRFMN